MPWPGKAQISRQLLAIGEDHCRHLLHEVAAVDLILIEGVMGLFDGERSSADLAALVAALQPQERAPQTPLAGVDSAYRKKQSIEITTLAEMAGCEIGMLSMVLVGNRGTSVDRGLMITPRGYGNKYLALGGKAVTGEQAGRSLSLGREGWKRRKSGGAGRGARRPQRLPILTNCRSLRWTP